MNGPSKSILVTGATGGIGLAVCDRLAKGGASLLFAARDASKLQSLFARLPNSGHDGHTWIAVDMTIDNATSNVIRCAWLAEAKTLALAFGDQGIHVNTLSLGGTLTPGYTALLQRRAANAGMSVEQRRAEETSNVSLHKYGTPEEVTGAVDGLLSAFSDHMTGHNVLHDGRFTRAYWGFLDQNASSPTALRRPLWFWRAAGVGRALTANPVNWAPACCI